MAIDRRGRSTYVPLRLWRSRRGAILIYQHASLRIVAIAELDVLVIWGDEHRAHCSPAELNRQRVTTSQPLCATHSVRGTFVSAGGAAVVVRLEACHEALMRLHGLTRVIM